ncbi:hypothetical protein FA95DRAFT_1576153 [Auriscalpium vulgare]|uniref:Uncharacterized protein n=1 Tax=Auriscalpium vulgare TaxID=40419 RepID=A0ACB8RDN6_9AGAM|nr:hypothetical protein FA95DRAFT_1576153 [Auriscalpium vulgare]
MQRWPTVEAEAAPAHREASAAAPARRLQRRGHTRHNTAMLIGEEQDGDSDEQARIAFEEERASTGAQTAGPARRVPSVDVREPQSVEDAPDMLEGEWQRFFPAVVAYESEPVHRTATRAFPSTTGPELAEPWRAQNAPGPLDVHYDPTVSPHRAATTQSASSARTAPDLANPWIAQRAILPLSCLELPAGNNDATLLQSREHLASLDPNDFEPQVQHTDRLAGTTSKKGRGPRTAGLRRPYSSSMSPTGAHGAGPIPGGKLRGHGPCWQRAGNYVGF